MTYLSDLGLNSVRIRGIFRPTGIATMPLFCISKCLDDILLFFWVYLSDSLGFTGNFLSLNYFDKFFSTIQLSGLGRANFTPLFSGVHSKLAV